MAEISDKLVIQLRIGNQLHQITVQRDKEKIFRDAAEFINEKFNKYSATFPNQSQEKYSAVVLIDLAVQILQIQHNNDTRPFVEAMEQLTKEIEETLEES
ncbi:cell division protein ZapA [Alloprevotella sp. OH1205_COT-284]|uniref:cell division protein ZapA n=1 Tax=Alloprevotella sp. OH1205_COT-284 TaxID=2491043 RepID=UPI000F5E282C|nr:cell division protein ZapA [Alloprevotella sp. OH1205_COT-284]RRD79490.1 cell division protein ZapA [Alloprevotella sp. OH1205_COT-284]